MRGAPAFEIDIGASRGWRAVIVAVVAATVTSLAAWAWMWTQPGRGLVVAAAVAAAWMTVGIGTSLWPRAGSRLRFDGAGWWLRAAPAAEEQPGAIQVAIDLDSFMLLCFRSPRKRLGHWIAIERGSGAAPAVGRAAIWHSLRCAAWARPTVPAPAGGAALAE